MSRLLCFLLIVSGEIARSQTSEVGFSSFGMGFGMLPSANSAVTVHTGGQFAGSVEGGNIRVESGFVNTVLLGGVSIVVTVQSEVARAGSPVGVSVILPGNVQTFAESLFYRMGGERNFSAIPLTRAGDTLFAAIPAAATTIRGVEYYIAASSAIGSVRFPASGVQALRVGLAGIPSPLTFVSRVYKMISTPVELNDTTVAGVLEDDYGPYNPAVWRLFRWVNGQNIEHPGIPAHMTPGKAFWLVTHSGGGFGVGSGRSVSTESSVIMSLDTGWNQIANPFAFRVSLSDVAVNGYISDLYYYDGVSPYIPNVTILEPWEGYFIENRTGQPITFAVPPLESIEPAPPQRPVLRQAPTSEYLLQLSAEEEGTPLKDVHNYIGFREGAAQGDDLLDQREPPSMSPYLQLSILDGRRYLSNFKPLPKEGEQWELIVTSTSRNGRVSTRLTESGTLPDGFGIYVLDKNDFNAIPVQDGMFSFELRDTPRRLKLIIGTEKYANEQSEGIPLVPVAYALHQNYPNPFNPTTTIRYQVSKRGGVVLEIFNLLGQHVKTLVNEEQVTGTYTVSWRGENVNGIPVASGVYVYRLRAGDFVASRKMLILR